MDRNNKLKQDPDQVPVSAVYLAEQTGVDRKAIHYWSRRGLIRHREKGGKSPYYLGDLEKIKLMKTITGSFSLEAVDAAQLAEELLQMYAEEPDAYQAAVNLLKMFNKSLTSLARVLAELGFSKFIADANLLESGEKQEMEQKNSLSKEKSNNGGDIRQ